MILGGAMIIGFSAFKGAEAYAGKKLDPVTVYFHGSTNSPADVQNQSLWTETPNNEDCGSGNNAACAMEVDASDLTGSAGSRSLNPSRITLNANPVGSQFIPSKNTSASAPGSQPISPINKL
ncbi:hypothetical protein ACR78U_20560 [Sphingobacterium siyangense]